MSRVPQQVPPRIHAKAKGDATTIVQSLVSPELYALILERDEARQQLERAQTGVTVCVPCFQQADYLGGCLESIAAQTVPAFETLVIDDGSHALESARIADIAGDFPDTRVVKVTNRKLPGARNAALMLTRTFAFLPLDADDWIDACYIEKTLPLLADADVVVPGLQEHGPTRNGTFMPGYDRPLEQVDVDLMWNGFNRTFYCNAAESPIWMADLSFRAIGDVQENDEIVGWIRRGSGKYGQRPKLVRARVLAAESRMAPLVRVEMESGRELRCTSDHWWLSIGRKPEAPDGLRRAHNGMKLGSLMQGGDTYGRAEPGRRLCHVVNPVFPQHGGEADWLAGWLAGMYDGEGTNASIVQSPSHNPAVCDNIRAAFAALDIPLTEYFNNTNGCIYFRITGGKQALVDFVAKVRPTRLAPLQKQVLKTKFTTPDRVARVTSDGHGEVTSLQTTTGNYIVSGYASKNCSLFRTQVLREAGGYNGLMVHGFEDYDLALDLMQRGARYRACDEVLFHYRTRPDGMLTSAMGRQQEIRAEMARHHQDLW